MIRIPTPARSSLLLACGTALALGTLSSAPHAESGRLSQGAGLMVGQTPYRDYDTQVMPIPIVDYQDENFFIRGASAGVYVLNTGSHRLDVNISYSPLSFDPSDSSDWGMKRLDKRRSTAMAGVGYRYNTADWGNIRLGVNVDVLGRSDGVTADVSYHYPFQLDRLRIEPGIGVQWQSSDFNDYYFGVSKRESQRSGLASYNAGSGASPYVSVSAHYAFDENWKAFATGRVDRLSNAIQDSPMADRSYTTSFGAGVMYSF